MSPHPPQKAKPWLGLPRGFPAAPAELGDLARLDFATTGFAYSDGPVAVQQAAVLAPEIPQAPPQVFTEAPPQAPVLCRTGARSIRRARVEPDGSRREPALVVEPVPIGARLAARIGNQGSAGHASRPGRRPREIGTGVPLRSRRGFRRTDPAIRNSAAAPGHCFWSASGSSSRTRSRGSACANPSKRSPDQAGTIVCRRNPGRYNPRLHNRSRKNVRSSVVPAPKPVPVRRQAAAETPQRFKRRFKQRVPERNAPKASAPLAVAPKPWESAAASETAIPY